MWYTFSYRHVGTLHFERLAYAVWDASGSKNLTFSRLHGCCKISCATPQKHESTLFFTSRFSTNQEFCTVRQFQTDKAHKWQATATHI